MPKRTLNDVAKAHGLSKHQLGAARNAGVNIWDDAQLSAWKSTRRLRIKPGANAKLNTPTDDAQTLEQIELELRTTRNFEHARILRERVTGLRGILALQKESRALIPADQVRESACRVYSAVKAELLRLAAELPGSLAGLTEAEIHRKLRAAIVGILADLSSENNTAFDAKTEPDN